MATKKKPAREPPSSGAVAFATRRAPYVIAAAVFALYWSVTHFEFLPLDDQALVVEDQLFLQKVGNLFASFSRPYFRLPGSGPSFYRPIVTASFLLDAQWSGTTAFGYHFTNVVLHAGACVLFYYLLRALAFAELPSLLFALLFAVHPANVETVSWIPGRNDALLAVASLGSLLLLADYARHDRPRSLWLHALLFAAALFTKETAILLPALFVAWLWLVEGQKEIAKRPIVWGPWVVAVVVYLYARASVITNSPGFFADRVQMAASDTVTVLLVSIGKIALPMHLSAMATIEDSLAWPGLVGLALLAAALFAASRRPQALRTNVAIFGAVGFVVTLLPVLLASRPLILENRLYLPAMFFLVVLAEPLVRLRLPEAAGLASFVVSTAILVKSTLDYQAAFREPLGFSEASVNGSPHLAAAHTQLGTTAQRKGDGDRALAEYKKAIEFDPREPIVHNNLGVLLMNRGSTLEAQDLFRQEIAVNPNYAPAFYNLGLTLRQLGNEDEAAVAWEGALKRNPDHLDAMGELLVHYSRKHDEAKVAYYKGEMSRRGIVFLPPGATAPPAQ